MKWRNLILLLVIVPVLLYGGVKGFFWYSIDAMIKQAKIRVAPSADITYREIRTSVLGPIGVTGITIRPHDINDVIKVGSILVQWDEPREILPILEALFYKKLPDKLNLSIERILLSLDGEIVAGLGQQQQWDSNLPFRVPASIWGCGSGKFQAADLLAMDYQRLRIDARMEYNYYPVTKNLSFFARIRSPDMMTLSFEGEVPSGKSHLSLNSIISSIPKMSNFSFALEDESYNAKKISYCSKKNKQSGDDFLDDHVQRIVADLQQSNLNPSTELTNAYRDFLSKPARISVNFDPYEPTGIEKFSELDRDNFAEWLGIEVLADQEPVGELLAPLQSEQDETEEPEQPVQKEEQFNPTPVADLGDFIGKLARVKTNDGRAHYAYIEKANTENLVLTRHLVGGSATFKLSYAEIIEVAVLY
jgi:hypothetical protein